VTMRYLIPSLPLPLRFAVFGALEAGGMFLQLSFPWGFLPGTLSMAAGWFPMFARGYRNRPLDLGFEDWKPASLVEYERIKDNLVRTHTVRVPMAYRRAFPAVVILPLAVLAVLGLTLGSSLLLPLLALDLFLLLVPFVFSGRVRLWTPLELAMKMAALEPVAQRVNEAGASLVLTPYLRFDRDRQGRQIPEDIRLMVEPRRRPADFLGVQLQVAINKGPNGAVPYMYAVFLCQGKGGSFRRLGAKKERDMIKEPGGDGEYGYVVLRQRTSGGGYHTDREDCSRLFDLVLEELRGLARP
jgi:hypothetical protein